MFVSDRCAVRTETPNKTCCSFPFVYDMTEYYTCIKPVPGQEVADQGASYCGIQPLVQSPQDLVRCIFTRDTKPTTPPLCRKNECKPVKAPPNEATALVYVVFGVKGIDKTSVDLRHVLTETQVFNYSILGCSDSILGCSDYVLGFSGSILGFSDSILGFSDSILEFSDSIVGFSDSILEFSDSIIGFSDSILGFNYSTLGFSDSMLGIQ